MEGDALRTLDHAYDLAGKRLVPVGAGVTAIQYVPEIQRQFSRLYALQRTPPWVMPHDNRSITEKERSTTDASRRTETGTRTFLSADRNSSCSASS